MNAILSKIMEKIDFGANIKSFLDFAEFFTKLNFSTKIWLRPQCVIRSISNFATENSFLLYTNLFLLSSNIRFRFMQMTLHEIGNTE